MGQPDHDGDYKPVAIGEMAKRYERRAGRSQVVLVLFTGQG